MGDEENVDKLSTRNIYFSEVVICEFSTPITIESEIDYALRKLIETLSKRCKQIVKMTAFLI
jgi:hypothetical protein